ncbi:MAG: riboflavin kinase [Tidjanibacter sp.]|nr:riboflavin kinase [Tidjanibacter sp.]
MKSNPLNIKIIGQVIYGNGLGHRIGFPTANLSAEDCDLGSVANGVYASRATVGGVCYPSIVNIGFSPSVVEGGCRRVEVHIIGFDADIYGQTIAVELVEFLRPECKFPSREALVDQIRKDVATATDKLKIEN